jgi:ornithine cyclodeaminase/alanine dehydrogenase-like protein (mu-crystallin family)
MEGTRPRYLDAAAVAAAMPPVDQRLALAERTLRALVDEADLPAKIGVHPRPSDSFAHAMPAALLPRDGADLLGIKWVTGFGDNAARGLPAIGATVLLNDPATGRLRAILDGAGITAERTAAVSGLAIARFGPTAAALGGRGPRVGLIGAGVQGHSHLAALGHVLPGATLAIFDRHADRAAALFLVDERGQFVANRDAGQFDGYPDPAATLGEALRAGTGRPAGGRVVVSHLGVGLADVVFGDAILARALELGLGQELGAADGHA